jgi:hypothetical protein
VALYLVPSIIFIFSALVMFLKPIWGGYLFVANLWLLSYPHTVATYQRSYFRQKYKRLLTFFIFLSLFGINVWIYRTWDFVALMNGYFYLQFFHYFRQNFGIAKIESPKWSTFDSWLFHLTSLSGLLALWSNEVTFLGYGLWSFEIFKGQEFVFYFFFSFSLLKVLFDLKQKRLSSPMFLIHNVLLAITVSIPNYFLLGWLGLHLFHNIQYLYLNWNLNRRYPFIWSYLKTVLLVFVLYKTAFRLDQLFYYIMPFSFIVILSVNYTHYFFDTYLWKNKFREQFP